MSQSNEPSLTPDQIALRMEEYKLFVEDTARFSERRQTITNTYISVNSAIAGLLAFLVKDSGLVDLLVLIAIIALICFGLLICCYWVQLINKYKKLVGFRVKLLHEMEDRLPDLIGVYHREDELYKPTQGKPLNISDLERGLPILFGLLYVILGIVLLWSLRFAPVAGRSPNVQTTPTITATPAAASPSP